MKSTTINVRSIVLAASLVLGGALVSVQAQTQTTDQQRASQNNAATQTQTPNLQTELNLSPEQIKQWRELNQEFRPQEIAGRERLAKARLAYAEAIDAQNPSEELIKQRAKELADAQSAMTQLQALRQARTLQMLTPEQRIKLREIRERNQAIRERNQAQLRQQGKQNGMGPQQIKRPNALLTPAQRKTLKQQQKQKR